VFSAIGKNKTNNNSKQCRIIGYIPIFIPQFSVGFLQIPDRNFFVTAEHLPRFMR
jgi:hypothetical protein